MAVFVTKDKPLFKQLSAYFLYTFLPAGYFNHSLIFICISGNVSLEGICLVFFKK
jgi:hypothetical protein